MRINKLLASPPIGTQLTVKGWVRTIRRGKKYSFIELNDGSCVSGLQLVIDNSTVDEAILKPIATGACISAGGTLVESTGKEQAIELQVVSLTVYGLADETFPIQKKETSYEFLREIAHLRPRTDTFGCVFRLRASMAFAIHRFFYEKGFFYLHSPIITGSDCEGAGEMFTVTTLPLHHVPQKHNSVDFSQDFFGKPAHLTVSGQLSAELAAMGLGLVYTFGPTFRAENSNTTRHLAEFWMIEPEMAFYELEDNMALAEELLKYLVKFALDNNLEDLQFLAAKNDPELIERLNMVANASFVRLTYTEAIEILSQCGRQFEFPVTWGTDLQSEHERYLVEQHFRKPVIVTHYPKAIKAFYMRMNDDNQTVRAMDILFPGVGEIIGGSQREERYDHLVQRLRELQLPEAEYWWYLDTRKFGTAPHSGFGLGFERLLLFLTAMGNIRDVIPFPRTPGNAEF